MSSSTLRILFAFLAAVPLSLTLAQQPNSPIEQARLFQSTRGATNSAVNADGMALPEDEAEASSDDSFGTQVILKKRERVPTVVVAGDASIFYTDNAALTPHNKIDDAFLVTNAGVSWTPRINPHLEAQLAAHASIFRYNSTSVLDFENFGIGAALFWTPEHCHEVAFFARYDLIELVDRHSNEILQDHEFSIGAQKMFAVGKAQTFTLGVMASGGIAMPASQQRQQAALFASYHWQITRAWDAELSWRIAGYYYNHADRTDGNQVVAANIRYRVSSRVDVNGFLSFGSNRSDTARFDYNAVTAGGGVAFAIRF
ncbi:MAG TPA: hypothetical protein VLO30_01235 [Chthoniobacterales bacterium]|nr:hypothetical protein [Chthoniobacterales bacterium]